MMADQKPADTHEKSVLNSASCRADSTGLVAKGKARDISMPAASVHIATSTTSAMRRR